MATIIDQFIDKVLKEDGSFTLSEAENPFDTERRYSFVQEKVGGAKFIYGEEGYNEDFFTSINKKFELVAIISGGMVFIVNAYHLGVYARDKIPENAVDFNACIQKLNDKVNREIFPSFYEKLEKVEVENEADCRKRARSALLSKNPEFWISEPEPELFEVPDLVKILCGLMDYEEEAKLRLERDEEDWCTTKARREKMQEMMKSPDLCHEWELAIAKGLNSVDAANVAVTFEMDGKSASAKIALDKILHKLMECDCFSDWDFATRAQGKKLFEMLGATSRWEGKPLKCEHISKITYGKKVLYERAA